MNTERYCIPIYLNDKVVMDLLAIFEDGFSNVRELKSYDDTATVRQGTSGASFGVSNILNSLLGVSLNVEKSTNNSTNTGTDTTVEKVHTNVSLFSKLRDRLLDSEHINIISNSYDSICEGSFVELSGVLRVNPMIETLETFIRVYEMAMRLSNDAELGNKKAMNAKKKEDEATIKQIKLLLDDMTKSETQDLLLTTEQGFNVILPSHISRFIETFDTDLYDGKYKVLGKVIRVIDENESINLFRKTSFKVFSETMLEDFLGEFNNSLRQVAQDGMNLPEVDSTIKGPAAIVIPIGIYA